MEYKIIYIESGKKSYAYEFANSSIMAKKKFLSVHPKAKVLSVRLK